MSFLLLFHFPPFLFPFLSSSFNLLTIFSMFSTAPLGSQCPCFLSCFTIRSLSLFLISLPPPRCLSANRRLTYNKAITMPRFYFSLISIISSVYTFHRVGAISFSVIFTGFSVIFTGFVENWDNRTNFPSMVCEPMRLRRVSPSGLGIRGI